MGVLESENDDVNSIDAWAAEAKTYAAWKRRAELRIDDERIGCDWTAEEEAELYRLFGEAAKTRFFYMEAEYPVKEAERDTHALSTVKEATEYLWAMIDRIIVSGGLDEEHEKYAFDEVAEWCGVRIEDMRYVRTDEKSEGGWHMWQNTVEVKLGDAPAVLANLSDEARLQAVRNVLCGRTTCVYKKI